MDRAFLILIGIGGAFIGIAMLCGIWTLTLMATGVIAFGDPPSYLTVLLALGVTFIVAAVVALALTGFGL